MMKPTAFLINTGRGGLIDETALKTSLETNRIAGAALDVLAVEPPPAQHPLLGVPNCLITPHQAWASREARQRLMDITLENAAAFIKGSPQNVVNP
jgi:glycerate dehydrogenase